MNYILEDLWSKLIMSDQTQHNILAKAVAKHLGEKLWNLSPPQEAILDHQLQMERPRLPLSSLQSIINIGYADLTKVFY